MDPGLRPRTDFRDKPLNQFVLLDDFRCATIRVKIVYPFPRESVSVDTDARPPGPTLDYAKSRYSKCVDHLIRKNHTLQGFVR